MHHRLFIAHHPICCAVAYLSRIGLFVMPWPVYDVSAYLLRRGLVYHVSASLLRIGLWRARFAQKA